MTFAILLSGGLDSTVLLWWMRERGMAARAVTIDYGQQQRRELAAAERVAQLAAVPHDIVPLPALSEFLPLQGTVVPNRNMILLSVSMAIAIAHDLEGVAFGANAGDRLVYADCRPQFIDAMQGAFDWCADKTMRLWAPFAGMAKANIVDMGMWSNAPLAETWTCYGGGEVHCGTCSACVTRREAFKEAGTADPTEYQQ